MGHPFHLVEYSPWPLLGSFAILAMPTGLVMYIKTGSMFLMFLGAITTTIIAYVWWRDIVRESTLQGLHNKKVVSGLKMGFVLFVVSEVCLFFSFFWAFFHSSLVPTPEIGCWPPAGIAVLSAFQVPLLNTSVLLLSGASITWSHHSLEANAKKSAVQGLGATLLLGIYFLWLQYGEYSETAFCIADSVYGSTFFIATGFHGMHVLVGATFLGICLARMASLHFNGNHHLGFVAAAWYWHFVDVVWLFLYVSIYWWGS
uniref:Cytochrome c oxidase subunit 3 n=1 Tax=Hermissenda emurai TaxID=1840523 RepID=A0A6H0N147_9GAST|nr:cytochrome c oxidase subunit III [Hermissenda emurai]QIV24377.1 cytochrome c oxidase subunit III [Hermissenda emurai]